MKKLFLMATACAMVLAGCSVDSIEEREYASRNIMPKDGTPYELEFMQQVVSEVAGTRAPMTELQPTHLYVEFTPATLEEYDRLLAAPQFECLPFDVFEVPELPQGAAYAVQPPCEGVGKLYALVRSDMTLPAVEYEVLKSYYTPYADNSGIEDAALARQIVARAEELNEPYRTRTEANEAVPHGSVRVYDNIAGREVGVQGVPVFVTEQSNGISFPKTETVYTDMYGGFRTKRTIWETLVTFRITFDTDTWSIKNSNGQTMVINGPTQHPGTVWRCVPMFALGANDAYYAVNILRGINAAQMAGLTFDTKLQIKYFDKSNSNYGETSEITGTVPYINIYCGGRPCQEIIGITNYGIGQAAYYRAHRTDYDNCLTAVKDSFAMYTRWFFTDYEYARLDVLDKLHTYDSNGPKPDGWNIQGWSVNNGHKTETPLFIDLHDGYNQLAPGTISFNNYIPNDNIYLSSYGDVQNIAFESATISNVRTNLLPLANDFGFTNADVTTLFRTYNQLSN